MENVIPKKGLFFMIFTIYLALIIIGPKTNKQNDDKKANGTTQIIVPSNLIIAGRFVFQFIKISRFGEFIFRRI
jgi:hypothetical protein